MEVERRLAALGLELPTPAPPGGNYNWAVRAGSLLFLATHGPFHSGQYVPRFRGKLGRDLDVQTGYEAARLATLHLLATLLITATGTVALGLFPSWAFELARSAMQPLG